MWISCVKWQIHTVLQMTISFLKLRFIQFRFVLCAWFDHWICYAMCWLIIGHSSHLKHFNRRICHQFKRVLVHNWIPFESMVIMNLEVIILNSTNWHTFSNIDELVTCFETLSKYLICIFDHWNIFQSMLDRI